MYTVNNYEEFSSKKRDVIEIPYLAETGDDIHENEDEDKEKVSALPPGIVLDILFPFHFLVTTTIM
jgi:hypothetical protein